MTTAAKIGISISVWISIIALTLTVAGSIAHGSVSFGRLSKDVDNLSDTANEAYARSILNQSGLAGVEATLKQMIKQLDRIEEKLK